jgi:O-antigen/teichoic acid export membrane protein
MDNIKKQAIKGLRWLEQYTKTDMVYLARGGSWLGLGQAISMGVAFLTSIAFANLLSPDTYGLYKYVLSLVAIITIPTLSGMDSAITRAVAQGFEGTIFLGLKEKIRFGVLSTAAGILTSLYYFIQGNKILGISFLIVGISVPLWESFDIYNALLNGKKLFGKIAKYYGLTQFLSFLAIIMTLLISKQVVFILLIYFVSNTIIRIVFFYKVIKEVKPNSVIDSKAISYGKHLSLMDIIGTFLGQFDKILIFHYLGAAELALYAIAIAPTEQIKGALKNIHTLALPRFSSAKKEDVRSSIFQKTIKLSFFIGIITLIYIVLAPYFFSLFFPKYVSAVLYSQIISVSVIGASLSMFLYTFLESHGEQRKLYQFNIYSNLINLAIVFLMIYYFGLWGAVISRMIIRFLLLGFSIYLVKKT